MLISWLNRGGLIRCVRRGWLYLVAAGFLLSCIAYVSGCGAGQQVISAQATVHRAHQPERFAFYAEEDERCGALHGGDREAYRECMRVARGVAQAADSYRAALEGAQAAVDVADEDGFTAMLPGLVRAAERLIAALVAAGVPVPETVRQVAAIAGGQ